MHSFILFSKDFRRIGGLVIVFFLHNFFLITGYFNIKAVRHLRNEIHRICIQRVIDENPKLTGVTVAVDESVFVKRKVSIKYSFVVVLQDQSIRLSLFL